MSDLTNKSKDELIEMVKCFRELATQWSRSYDENEKSYEAVKESYEAVTAELDQLKLDTIDYRQTELEVAANFDSLIVKWNDEMDWYKRKVVELRGNKKGDGYQCLVCSADRSSMNPNKNSYRTVDSGVLESNYFQHFRRFHSSSRKCIFCKSENESHFNSDLCLSKYQRIGIRAFETFDKKDCN